jgi:putative ABC transport system ATP-binding protein
MVARECHGGSATVRGRGKCSGMTALPAILEARNVGRAAADGQDWLIRGITLVIRPGDRLALVGPSGSGKTVLLRALALLDPLDEGELLWRDRPVIQESVPRFRSRIVYLHQRPALIEGTVEDNLRYPFQFTTHKHRRYDADKIGNWLSLLGRPPDFLQKVSRDLSGGELQITALLRAMQLEPEVLLLDEPTAALDHAATEAVQQCVEQWQREQRGERSFVLVSHNMPQAERLADRILVMRAGRLDEGS